ALRLQQLANAQAKGNNQHDANNENDDVIRNELNEQNVEDVALGNHHQPQRARGSVNKQFHLIMKTTMMLS
ncbi:hypothetical protein HAX54_019203, partial [Datura stramonium]|nr:hypothetical protein [Datura stramonium]